MIQINDMDAIKIFVILNLIISAAILGLVAATLR